MDGFALLCAHLMGDYILQNDWMAGNKTNPHPGPTPPRRSITVEYPCRGDDEAPAAQIAYSESTRRWEDARSKWLVGHLACTAHCLLYTLAVWAFTFWWMPLWGLAACFLIHWPVDRFRLAAWWMKNVSGQSFFASKDHPLFPWSIIVVDNTAHLLTLYLIGLLAGT